MDALTQGRVRLHQMLVRQGDPGANTEVILAAMAQARADGIRVTVFPEWALSGFLAGPEWLDGSRLRACERGLARIVEASQGLAVILGTVVSYRGRLVGAAVAAEDGRRVAPAGSPLPFVPKLLSPQNRFDGVSGLLCAGAVAAMEGVPLPALFAPFTLSGMTVAAWCGQALPNGCNAVRQDADLLLRLDTRPYTRDQPLGDAPVADDVPAACCAVLAWSTPARCCSRWRAARRCAGRTDAYSTRRCCARRRWILRCRRTAPSRRRTTAPRVVIDVMERACRLQLERLGCAGWWWALPGHRFRAGGRVVQMRCGAGESATGEYAQPLSFGHYDRPRAPSGRQLGLLLYRDSDSRKCGTDEAADRRLRLASAPAARSVRWCSLISPLRTCRRATVRGACSRRCPVRSAGFYLQYQQIGKHHRVRHDVR